MRARLIVLLAALAACGVPTADHASTARGSEVPYGLLEVGERTSTTLPELSSAAATIWLVAADRIHPITREVASPSSITRAFEALSGGPTDNEAQLGLRSAVPTDAIEDVAVADGVATVDLADVFVSSAPREQLLALAQLVYTATQFRNVEVVQFTLGGEPIEVPRGDGEISEGPVRRRDFAALAT